MSAKDKTNEKDKNKVSQENTPMGLFQGKLETPPFLTTIRIFGENLHNYLLDSRASTNVIPLAICKALRIVPTPPRRKVTQLGKIEVNIVGKINWIPM